MLAAAGACRDYYRADLERQHRLLRSVGRWYVAPLVPGYIAMLAAKLRSAGGPNRNFMMTIVLGVGVVVVVLWLNSKGEIGAGHHDTARCELG